MTTSAPETLVLRAKLASPSLQTNTATIEHSDQYDPDRDNNSASVVVTPEEADLGLAKSVDDSIPTVGDTITFTITLTNYGPDRATSVEVQDQLPTGLSFVTATPRRRDI